MAELKKTITLWKGVALAVCTVIGSGLLGLPGMTLEIGSAHSVAGGWLLISLTMLPMIAIFSCLGLRFTSSAGLSKYAEEAVGPWGRHAVAVVLCGTFMFGIPAMAFIGAAYVQRLFGLPSCSVCGLAVTILVVATAINLMGVRAVSLINTASLVALAAMMALIVVTHFAFFVKGLFVFGETVWTNAVVDFWDVWRIAALLFWAFVGWENLSFSLEEFKRPEKSIPRVYWLSFLVVVCLYFGLTITSIGAEASGVSVKGASGLAALMADSPLGIFQLLILILVIPANLNAWIFGASRLYFSSGQAGVLPSFWGRLTRGGLPLNSLAGSLAVYVVVALATQWFGISLTTLVLLVNQNALVLYAFSIFAYWKTERGVRRWVVTALAAISCGFLLFGFSWWILYSLGLLALGYGNYCRVNCRVL